MAGVTIRVDDREVREALKRLARAGGDVGPALREIGEALLRSHRERFDREQDPEGKPWASLAESTLRRKMLRGVGRKKGANRKNLTGRDGSTKAGGISALAGAKILVERGYLHDLLRYQVEGGVLRLGTDRVYGPTHQFGDPRRNIPARPFLGLSAADRQMVVGVLQRHLARALRG